MNYIGFAFNFNIQRCEVPVGEEWKIIKYGYRPLFESLLRYKQKANLFLTGYSTQTIAAIDPELIDLIRDHLVLSEKISQIPAQASENRIFSLGTYTYTHPIMQLLVQSELEAQIERGISIDQKYYGIKPKGFFPPEFAFTHAMARELSDVGIEWTIVLSDFAYSVCPDLKCAGIHRPYIATQENGPSIGAIPIALDLKGLGKRFFKRMLLGSLSTEDAIAGIKIFLENQDEVFLILERDAETIYIDDLNSGIAGTQQRLDTFLESLTQMVTQIPGTKFSTIDEYVDEKHYSFRLSIPEYLGNTKIETFTEGISKTVWEYTCKVRDRLFSLENKFSTCEGLKEPLAKAWEHLLLSHNSDGRIGYWHSDWLPGEHITQESRKKFVLDNLAQAEKYLDTAEAISD